MSKWMLLARPSKGDHTLWAREGDDRVFVADCSGRTPDQTDDGPLALDTRLILSKGHSKVFSAYVAVTKEDGSRGHTALSPEVAQWLVVYRGFTVELDRELAKTEALLRAALSAL